MMGILDWPGKSPVSEGAPLHPAAYHMLDVAAVAERLIAPFDLPRSLRDALVLLVALHDLGKISESFRAMLTSNAAQVWRHWELTEVLLHEHDSALAAKLGGGMDTRLVLYAATAGHHGRPPDQSINEDRTYRKAMRQIGAGVDDAAGAIAAFCDLWPDASLDGVTLDHAYRLSWWLPGLCAAADWIGSNADWFSAQAPDLSLNDYLLLARQKAVVAVNAAGLGGSDVRGGSLFDFPLRPMQAACRDVGLAEGPMLAVIEDETGAGKTEAALILAHRMAQAGKGRGLFFALPTMATADAMFSRASQVIGKMFSAPSLTLAHGRAGLSDSFRAVQARSAAQEDEPNCTGWLAQSRKRALLADVGIGTIDQALLAVLPVKHQTLRHFGLSSKILIVDEVHEMGEAYIAKELQRLLQMHRAAGGSAILLTATLPLDLRQMLLATYSGTNPDPAYPALSVAGGEAISSFDADTRAKKGPVTLTRIASMDDAVTLIAEKAALGAACAWVRNSVDDVMDAVAALRAAGITAHLLHARFALNDRKRIEADVLGRVGRDGQGRAGYVLVATQVLQASLDLDFDVMVTDIAPVAEVIQRAGRLWRHMEQRPAATRPVPAPVLHILSPDPDQVEDDRWLHGAMKGGAWVYSVVDAWRTARVLFKAGQIDAPTGLRGLIEAVYGPSAEQVPEVFTKAEAEVLGKGAAAAAHAVQNLVDLGAGYRFGGKADDDAEYPTRLGEESQTLILARQGQGGLVPWAAAQGISLSDAWALSEVSASRKKLARITLPDQSTPAIQAATRDWPDWRREGAKLCPVADDGTICEGLRYDGATGLIFG